jgi:hypothetical protein
MLQLAQCRVYNIAGEGDTMEYREEIRRIAGQLNTLPLISLQDIPRIDLYMEQVTTFFEEEMGDVRRGDEEKNTHQDDDQQLHQKRPFWNRPAGKNTAAITSSRWYISSCSSRCWPFRISGICSICCPSRGREQSAALYTVFSRMIDDLRQTGGEADRRPARPGRGDAGPGRAR